MYKDAGVMGEKIKLSNTMAAGSTLMNGYNQPTNFFMPTPEGKYKIFISNTRYWLHNYVLNIQLT